MVAEQKHAIWSLSQTIITSLSLFQNHAKILDLRCVLLSDPSTLTKHVLNPDSVIKGVNHVLYPLQVERGNQPFVVRTGWGAHHPHLAALAGRQLWPVVRIRTELD